MKNTWLLLMVLAMVASATSQAIETEEDRKAKQTELDAVCEVARQKKLVPLRAQYVEECVEKKQRPDRESCERVYADYDGHRGGQPTAAVLRAAGVREGVRVQEELPAIGQLTILA